MDMKKRKAVEGDKVYILRVTMPEEESEPFRTLAVLSDVTLNDLAEVITQSFGFDFDHAFGFYDDIDFWMDSVEGYELYADIGEESKYPGVETTLVSKVFDAPGKQMLFLFDYGDQWSFLVELEEIRDAEAGKPYPQLVTSDGEAPLQYGDGEIDEDDEAYDEEEGSW
jgi:hypothetical protein